MNIYYKFVNKLHIEIEKISNFVYTNYGPSLPKLLNIFRKWNVRHKIDNDGQYISFIINTDPVIEILL